jgi:hypothetical protein
MTAKIIDFPASPPASGNGAREAVTEVFGMPTADYGHLCPADFILTMLWLRGFKVVPVEFEEISA